VVVTARLRMTGPCNARVAEIVVRAAEPTDLEAIHEILRCPRVAANTLQLPWRPLSYTRERFFQTTPDVFSFVAEIDNRVVGNLGIHIEQGARRRDVGKFGMSVHDDFQNRGVGSALMATMIDLADNWLGLRRIELEVWTDNALAIHLYEKFGFVIEGTGRQFARRAGELVDCHYMARLRTGH
jgi:L-phenylalanine/L-methionine N-acetyltransferase